MNARTLGGLVAAAAVLAACSSSSGTTTPATADSGTPPPGDAASGGDTWASFGQGFFATYCVECHGAGNAKRDYTTLANVTRDKNEVRCGVAATQDPSWSCGAFPPPKQFPISDAAGTNPKPSDADRARAVAWITAGLPQ